MYRLLDFMDANATGVLFNVAVVTIFFTVARLLRVRASLALAIAFAPLVLAWAFGDASTHRVITDLMNN